MFVNSATVINNTPLLEMYLRNLDAADTTHAVKSHCNNVRQSTITPQVMTGGHYNVTYTDLIQVYEFIAGSKC